MPAEVLIDRDSLRDGVARIAAQMSAAHPNGLVAVSVLKGSLLFLADLVRLLTVPVRIEFLAISTYEPGSGRVRIVKDLDSDVSGEDVVLVEDVVDTGLTLAYLLGELGRRQPASLEVCTLLDKQARRILPATLHYVGFEVPDVFLLGYGLDFAGRYRNLDLIVAGDTEVLAADPDAYLDQLYGNR